MTAPERPWPDSKLATLQAQQEELNSLRRAGSEWVAEHGYPPPLSRTRRVWLRLRRLLRRLRAS